MNRRQLVFGRELRKLLPVSDGDWIWEHDHRARMAPRRRSERALEIVHTSDSDRLRKTLHQSALDGMKTQCHDDGNRARRLLRGHGRSCRERSDDVDLELDQFGRPMPAHDQSSVRPNALARGEDAHAFQPAHGCTTLHTLSARVVPLGVAGAADARTSSSICNASALPLARALHGTGHPFLPVVSLLIGMSNLQDSRLIERSPGDL
jgi:hypothetical protein